MPDIPRFSVPVNKDSKHRYQSTIYYNVCYNVTIGLNVTEENTDCHIYNRIIKKVTNVDFMLSLSFCHHCFMFCVAEVERSIGRSAPSSKRREN